MLHSWYQGSMRTMTHAKAILLGILWACCTPVLGAQIVAHQLRYPVWLGSPLMRLGRLWLYSLHHYPVWYWKYGWYYPAPFEWGLAAMAVWMIAGAVLVAMLLKRSGWQRRSAYANTAWASPGEIRKAGLFVHLRK